ncbi:Selenocysteine lyase/Cysteine desulfurase [Kytococcus aerolatus]|uniref:Selenocysteine lyase/Cysteine desulfurase n=1 Tax=Kytococcus aerolatus TaxID=592308 RepID=A0A212T5F4_9MICO|nr:aminotransferase class V-fold PLP-dependent enzyme [Kytococcus aerolatus]SNC61249.1 Selenocysteine lyase/Cysteine desulfurase [Kytococcus aerolatus]
MISVASPGTRTVAELREEFATPGGYLDAATCGLPTRRTTEAMARDAQRWARGEISPVTYHEDVTRARALYAALVGIAPERVATGSQTSVFAGMIAASVPDGAEVVVIGTDFSSLVYPFLVQAQRPHPSGSGGRITVRTVERADLAGAVTERTAAVVFSQCQSACGSLTDLAEVAAAARAVGALTVCDITQSLGWRPVDAGLVDITLCSAYKWMCQPRGTAYMTVSEQAMERIVPVAAGWYAGDVVWDSMYGPEMHLADRASRFDVSPGWPLWPGAVAALEDLSSVSPEEVRAHDVGLANRLRTGLGLEAGDSAIVSLALPQAATDAVERAGLAVSQRAGGLRLSFHVWNTEAEADRAAEVLAPFVRH